MTGFRPVKKPIHHEEAEQVAVVNYCAVRNIPIFAVPNGGHRNALEAKNLKRSGVKAGVPDLVIPLPNKTHHGLFIEMKFGKNKATGKQSLWQRNLRALGYRSEVCNGFAAAVSVIEEYIADADDAYRSLVWREEETDEYFGALVKRAERRGGDEI